MGYREVPEILEAADRPIERGHHVAMACGPGAGEDAVYARAVGKACEVEPDAQAIVLTFSRDRALRIALALQQGLAPHGIRAAVPPLRTDGSVDVAAAGTQCLVERPSVLLPEVRLGRLHLGGLRLLVLDGLADLEDLDEWTSAEPLIDTLSADTQRVAVSRRMDDRFRELVLRQLPRARQWPEELFRDTGDPAGPVEAVRPAVLDVGLAASELERLGVLVEELRSTPPGGRVRVRCREERSLPRVRSALESVGLTMVAAPDGWDVEATRAAVAAGESDSSVACVWFGLPLSVEHLRQTAPDDRRIAIVDVLHHAQLHLLAERAGLRPRPLAGPRPTAELESLGRYRSLVRSRIEKGGTDAELLVLEPLLDEYGSARVASALSNLLRLPGSADAAVRPWADVEAASLRAPRSSTRPPDPRGAAHRGTRAAWSRIFIGAGNRDSVRAADLVGAITGETGIAGAQIGKIEIRGSFSLVEVDSQVVDDVIRKLDGTGIRGRAVTVKRDRGD
jgi:ATP-dependent RNA helicase DeaD